MPSFNWCSNCPREVGGLAGYSPGIRPLLEFVVDNLQILGSNIIIN